VKPTTLRVNGHNVEIRTAESTPLVYVLRNELGLTGTTIGCALEQCGACAVLVDGRSTLTCSAPAGQFAGRDIVTIEATDHVRLQAVKEAFVHAGAAQCGYCIPGMVIAVAGLLERNAQPTEAELREALRPHLCRCGTHARVLEAARSLARRQP
jgi:aerobic-type carbon monoxide dehydrogenase small subunit (CoxS/CutS family)